jgi:hypothetical protein
LQGYVPKVKVRFVLFRANFIVEMYDLVLQWIYDIVLLQLPVTIDIIKHSREIDGKSTAIHAALLAPDDVTIYTYPCIPDYGSDERVNCQRLNI